MGVDSPIHHHPPRHHKHTEKQKSHTHTVADSARVEVDRPVRHDVLHLGRDEVVLAVEIPIRGWRLRCFVCRG